MENIKCYNENFVQTDGRKKSKIICSQCGYESVMSNNTIKKRYDILKNHYCEYCVPKRSAAKKVNPLKYSLLLRNSNSNKKGYLKCNCEKCNCEFEMLDYIVKKQILKDNIIKCNNCSRQIPQIGECSSINPRSKVKQKCDECGSDFYISYQRMNTRYIKYKKHLCKSCSRKGKNNPFYGKQFSDESIEKIRKSKIDFYNSDKGLQTKEEQSIRQLKNLKPIYIYDENNNKELLGFREQVILRDNFICKKCNMEQDEIILEVHHLNSVDKNNDRTFDFDNVVTLCTKCHRIFHRIYGYGKNTKEQFDSFLLEGSETIEIAANKLKKSRVEFSKFEMGGPEDPVKI